MKVHRWCRDCRVWHTRHAQVLGALGSAAGGHRVRRRRRHGLLRALRRLAVTARSLRRQGVA